MANAKYTVEIADKFGSWVAVAGSDNKAVAEEQLAMYTFGEETGRKRAVRMVTR